VVTRDKDSALYLATFGVLNLMRPDLRLLQELVNAGQWPTLSTVFSSYSKSKMQE